MDSLKNPAGSTIFNSTYMVRDKNSSQFFSAQKKPLISGFLIKTCQLLLNLSFF